MHKTIEIETQGSAKYKFINNSLGNEAMKIIYCKSFTENILAEGRDVPSVHA